jgi:hypothetical protein
MSAIDIAWMVGGIGVLFLTFLLIEIESDGIQGKLRTAAGFGFIIGIVYILAMDVMFVPGNKQYAQIHNIVYTPMPFVESTLPGIILIVIAIVCVILSFDKIRSHTKNVVG